MGGGGGVKEKCTVVMVVVMVRGGHNKHKVPVKNRYMALVALFCLWCFCVILFKLKVVILKKSKC